jgi:protein O-mannosyl-transferase
MTDRLRVALLLAVSTLVYANSLLNTFTFDDFPYVLNNPAVTSPSLQNLFSATKGTNVFRPVTFASFALNWKLGDIHPWGYHLFNLLLHAAVTVLLFFVLRKLLESRAHGPAIAFVTALLFAVHPVHAEAVASIVGRSELLAAAFLLAAWLLHLDDRVLPSLLFFALALLSKESAIAFLPLVFIGDYLRDKLKPASRYLWILAISLLYAAALWKAQGGRFGEFSIDFLDNPLAKLSAPWRILNALRVAWMYIALQLYPATLSADYSYNAIHLYLNWRNVLPALIASLGVALLWLWALKTKKTAWALTGAIYFAGFAATANILIPTGTILGERLAYFPSAGLCLLVALVWLVLAQYRPTAAWTCLIAILLALSARTILRNADWRTNFTLFSSAVKAVPGAARMHSNLGAQYMDAGQLETARAEFQTALSIYPDFPDALEFYGLTEGRLGNDQQALPLLERALLLTKQESVFYGYRAVNLAALLIKLGQDTQALNLLNQAIAASPGNPRAWSNRAVIHYRTGDLPAARSDAQMALKLDPQNPQAQSLLNALH